jgi:hypothetical protein
MLMNFLISAVIFFVAFTHSLALAAPVHTVRSRPRSGIAAKSETDRILRVLEERMQGQRLQEKARDKLSKLSPEQIRLLDSLAVRIMKNDHTAASDIAFLLITTLIISS